MTDLVLEFIQINNSNIIFCIISKSINHKLFGKDSLNAADEVIKNNEYLLINSNILGDDFIFSNKYTKKSKIVIYDENNITEFKKSFSYFKNSTSKSSIFFLYNLSSMDQSIIENNITKVLLKKNNSEKYWWYMNSFKHKRINRFIEKNRNE